MGNYFLHQENVLAVFVDVGNEINGYMGFLNKENSYTRS